MTHLIVGAGQIGRRLARHLAEIGRPVTLASRSSVEAPGVSMVTVDASDQDALTAIAQDAEIIYLTTSPSQYHRWPELWPPILSSVLAAARGRKLVMMGNLYAYGRADMPMTEHSPLVPADPKGEIRRDLWLRALEAHERGEVEAVEVRASDYFGPGVERTAMLGARFFEPLLHDQSARVIGDVTMPHSWTYLDDIATTLMAAGDYRGEWGRAWHVPASATMSCAAIADEVKEQYGGSGKVVAMPGGLLRALSIVSPSLRALRDSSYQFTSPFIIDATETSKLLRVEATPWPQALEATVAAYR